MAKIKRIVFFLFITISNLTIGQTPIDKSSWIIKWNITAMGDIFTFPTVELGVEKKITDFFSVYLEAGYQFYGMERTDTVFVEPKGYRVNIECRYYLSKLFSKNPKGNLNGFYIGIQGFYRKNQYNSFVEYSNTTNAYNEDEFGVYKTNVGGNLIGGYQKTVFHRFTFEAYTGIGGMNKIIKNTDRQYEDGLILGTDLVPLFESLHLSESSGVKVSMIIGFRIGYNF